MSSRFESSSGEWSGPAAWRGVRFSFWRLLQSLIVPPKGQRILPTLAGYALIMVAIGMGMAAYNASSNVLFIALSLLLASLITSGILSWINFHGLSWRILAEPPFRAGEECRFRIEIRNSKKRIPTYALAFQVEAKRSRIKAFLNLGRRLDPQESAELEFLISPRARGSERIAIVGVISQFPFGFLKKSLGGRCSHEVVVWPRRIPYRFQPGSAIQALFSERTLNKPGHGSEFINLRAYREGDSHRQVHWKASARLRTLVVQQYAAEDQPGYIFEIESSKEEWRDAEEFEKLCSFVSSLAEDLHQAGLFHGARINGEPLLKVGRNVDFEDFQNRLAILERIEEDRPARQHSAEKNVLTFKPEGKSEIHAYIGGQKTATA